MKRIALGEIWEIQSVIFPFGSCSLRARHDASLDSWQRFLLKAAEEIRHLLGGLLGGSVDDRLGPLFLALLLLLGLASHFNPRPAPASFLNFDDIKWEAREWVAPQC